MKIAIIGHSGAGKSTLAARLGQLYYIPVLHIDSVYWLENWVVRPREETRQIISDFLDDHSAWVIDGTYSRFCFDRRMAEADVILFLDLPPLACLYRVTARWLKYHGRTRPDMGPGCREKLDAEFIRWVLYKGRGTEKDEQVFGPICRWYNNKTAVLKNQRQIDLFLIAAEKHAANRKAFHKKSKPC